MNDHEEQPATISSLPSEVLHNTVSYLDSRDALRCTVVNTWFCHTLSLSTIQGERPIIESSTWRNPSDIPYPVKWIPLLLPQRTHSVVLTWQWNDQGWGNRKGFLYVVEVPADTSPNSLINMNDDQVVFESPLAPHEMRQESMSFNTLPDKAYYLWMRVGGGGGHELTVRNLTMRTIIHDEGGRPILRNHNALFSIDASLSKSSFHWNMLKAVAKSVEGQLADERPLDVHLASVLESANIPITPASMKALVELATALAFKHEKEEECRRVFETA